MTYVRMKVVFHDGTTGIVRMDTPVTFEYNLGNPHHKEWFDEGIAVWSLIDAVNVRHAFNADGTYHDWEGPLEMWPFIDDEGKPFRLVRNKQGELVRGKFDEEVL